MRIFIQTLCFLGVTLALSCQLYGEGICVDDVDRRIDKLPEWQSKPQYALLIFGADANDQIWIIRDDDRLYVDRNGNRDLTDDGAPIIASEKKSLGQNKWDRNFTDDGWELSDGSVIREFHLRHWNYDDPEDMYGLSLTLHKKPGRDLAALKNDKLSLSLSSGNKVPMYAGWFPLLATSPEKAAVIHFGGPVEPRMIRYKEFVLGSKPSRLSIAFATPKETKLTSALLSIDGLPGAVKPKFVIEWPIKPGSQPLETTHVLGERCCYWEYYTSSFSIPDRAIPGTAKVSVIVPRDQFPLELIKDRFEVNVVRQKEGADGNKVE